MAAQEIWSTVLRRHFARPRAEAADPTNRPPAHGYRAMARLPCTNSPLKVTRKRAKSTLSPTNHQSGVSRSGLPHPSGATRGGVPIRSSAPWYFFRIPVTSAPHQVCSLTAALSALALTGCVMDGPFVDRDIDRLVSSDSTTAWSAGGGPTPVTPLAIPAAAASATGDPSVSLATGEAAENETLTGSSRETLSLTRCIDVALSASPRTRG